MLSRIMIKDMMNQEFVRPYVQNPLSKSIRDILENYNGVNQTTISLTFETSNLV